MKICLSCAPGGHLSQLLEIREAFDEHETFFVLIDSEITQKTDLGRVIHVKTPPQPRKIKNFNLHKFQLFIYYLSLVFPSVTILLKERPHVIVGHGGSATLILFYIGKFLGTRLIFIETVERVKDLSGTGKLVYPITDLFIVQWESLKKKYEKSVYWGRII